MIGKASQRFDVGGAGDRARHLGEGQALRAQPGGIDVDMELADLAALHVDTRDAGHARDQRAQLVLREVVQLRRRQGVRAQAVGQHGIDAGRVHPLRMDAGAGRQVGQHLADRGVDVEESAAHVRAPVEGDVDLRAAAAGGGAHVAHAAHAPDRFFDRRRDRDHHLAGGTIAGVDAHAHARE